MYPELEWDFRLPLVCSINVSGHKYGLVYPGLGWLIFRSKAELPERLVFKTNYLGSEQLNFTLNFSKSASPIVGQYYMLLRLGREGYTRVFENLARCVPQLLWFFSPSSRLPSGRSSCYCKLSVGIFFLSSFLGVGVVWVRTQTTHACVHPGWRSTSRTAWRRSAASHCCPKTALCH